MKVLTANRLHDGVVVYSDVRGGWTHRFSEAARLDEAGAAAALETALAASELLVGPYLLEADEGGPVGRERLRERIRAGGPTAGSTHGQGA